LHVPSSTISEPLGRQIRILDENGDYIDSDPAEFVLNSFLPGGFKIRYRGRMWMCPWQFAVGRQVIQGSNLTWAQLTLDEPGTPVRPQHPHLGTAPLRQRLDTFLAERTDLTVDRRNELLNLIGQNATLASVSSIRLQDVGSATNRRFTLDE